MATKIEKAYQVMSTPSDVVDFEKFEAVVSYASDYLAGVSPMQIADFIDGGEDGWDDPDEHNSWLKSAPADEIGDWIIAGLR